MLDLARTIRFAIPTVVARALPVWDLSARARIDGELGPRLEYFEYRYPRHEVVLTCAPPMAHFVLRQLHTLADRAVDAVGDQSRRRDSARYRGGAAGDRATARRLRRAHRRGRPSTGEERESPAALLFATGPASPLFTTIPGRVSVY